MRPDRRRDLIRILEEGSASSQQEIVGALRERGHDVTQATVSRDLARVGAVKIRRNGHSFYGLPTALAGTDGEGEPDLLRTLDAFALEISPAASIVVVKTAPGHAAVIARSIDLAGLDDVVGSVAGDDTIFVATRSPAEAEKVAVRWRAGAMTRAEST